MTKAPEIVSDDLATTTTRGKKSFASDVMKLASGATIAQAASILAAPLLTRLYQPDDFGTAALFTSIISIIGVIVCLRYEFSIMLPENDEEAANLLGVSLSFTLLITTLTIPLITWGRGPLLRALKAPELEPYLFLIPVMAFLTGIFQGLNYWSARTKKFGRLSIANVAQSMTNTGAQLGSGYTGHNHSGSLIGATTLGKFVATLLLGWQVWRNNKNLFKRSVHWQDMVEGLKRHRKFPLYDTWSALLNNLSWQLPTFLLSIFFSPVAIGYYTLGNRLLRVPAHLIGNSIAQVFFQRASEAKLEDNLPQVVESTFRRLVMLTLFPLLLLTVTGRDLFMVAFGETWAEAGVYTQILSPWTFFWFISSPLSTLFIILEKQEFNLFINIIIFVTRLASLVIGGVLQNARLAILLFSASGVLVYGYLSLKVMTEAGVTWSKMLKITFTYTLYFIPAGLLLLILKLLHTAPWITAVTTAILLVVYLGFAIWHDPQIRKILKSMFKSPTK